MMHLINSGNGARGRARALDSSERSGATHTLESRPPRSPCVAVTALAEWACAHRIGVGARAARRDDVALRLLEGGLEGGRLLERLEALFLDGGGEHALELRP
eukprot:5939400-Prymnesium_polylepis.3